MAEERIGCLMVTLAQRRLAFESQMELFDDEEYLEYRPCQCHL